MKISYLMAATVILMLSLGVSSAAVAAEDGPMMPYGEIYTGPKNESVEIAYFKDGNSALVHIWGVNNSLNNKILKTTVHYKPAGGREFVAKIGNADVTVVTMGTGDARDQGTKLMLPNYDDTAIPMTFDKDASKNEQPLQLNAAYGQQSK